MTDQPESGSAEFHAQFLVARTAAEMESESLQSTGARLRWLRSRSGRSMGDLARFLGCGVEEVSNLERDNVGRDVFGSLK